MKHMIPYPSDQSTPSEMAQKHIEEDHINLIIALQTPKTSHEHKENPRILMRDWTWMY